MKPPEACPWCGFYPMPTQALNNVKAWAVVCINRDCEIAPRTNWHPGEDATEAIEIWNNRRINETEEPIP